VKGLAGTQTPLGAASRSPSIRDLVSLTKSESLEDAASNGSGIVGAGRDHDVENWELVEVGRGLANYNSAQINTVKGVNSSNIYQLLGYADSDYVVENITIRVPP